MGLHMLWCANLELALELSSALSCINVWKACFFLWDPLLGRGRLWDVWSSSFLRELILSPYVWELLMKWIRLSCVQVVVVSAPWCCTPGCTPSVVADCACAVSFPLGRLTCGTLSLTVVLSTVSQLHGEIVSGLQSEIKTQVMGGLLFEKRMMNSLYAEIWILTGLCQGLWIFPTHTFPPLQEIIYIPFKCIPLSLHRHLLNYFRSIV